MGRRNEEVDERVEGKSTSLFSIRGERSHRLSYYSEKIERAESRPPRAGKETGVFQPSLDAKIAMRPAPSHGSHFFPHGQ